MRHYTAKKNAITISACLLFIIFVFTNEIQTRNKAESLIRQHALIVASVVWNVNIEGTAEYLRLAAAASQYSNLTIYERNGEIFQTLDSGTGAPYQQFFQRLHLTPEIHLRSPIMHQGIDIGTIEAIYHPPTLYTDFYILVLLVMLTAMLHMYLRSLLDKTVLEKRISARTKELAQSNRILLREIHQKKKTSAILRKSEEEYRQLYQEAKSAEEVYRSLINSSADAILICDLDTKVKDLSAAFTALFGWTLDELMGTKITFFAPDEQEAANRIFEDIRENGASYQAHELQALTKTEQLIDISLSGSRFNNHRGHPIGMLFVIRDISYHKRMEKQLQRAERLEAVGTLAGGIAHDFNNLLMGIQGNTSLALLEIAPENPVREKIEAIETYVQSGQELTARLLGFARGGKYEIKPTDLNRLFYEETRLFARTRKDITFSEEFQKMLWPVEVDRGQLKQVLLNLYVNASQAMPEGGSIRIATRNVHLDGISCSIYEIPSGRYVQTQVTDSGHGMDKETMARIFDPFFTTKEIGRGTGLGLASAYGIIKNHNGYIDVYSEPGEGTTFTIYLPASEKDIEEDHIASELLQPIRGNETILLVDDEELIRKVGEKMLEVLGYSVIMAGSGREACEIYKKEQHRIGAVILDMIMPDMDGGAVFEQLKEINPRVRVMLSSGYALNDKAQSIMAQGCAGFLQKPFNLCAGFLQKPFNLIMLSAKLKEIIAPGVIEQ